MTWEVEVEVEVEVTELEDLFNGPSSVSREDAVSYDQLHVPISLPGDPMAME